MKKILSMALMLLMLVTLTVAFVGCGDDDGTDSSSSQATSSTAPIHQHTYASEWSSNESGHYKACTCHPSEITVVSHKDSVDRDGRCDVCQYVLKENTTFKVSVKDDSGNPIKGVEIKIYTSSVDKTVTTDENGNASCEITYFDEVKARIVSVPEGYENIADTIYTFEGTELSIEINETVFFELVVLDESGKGLGNVIVNITTPFTSVTTNKDGVARFNVLKKDLGESEQFIYISQMPEGYVLTDTPFNSLLPIENNSTYTAHAAVTINYTVSAKDKNGNPLANAVFTFKQNGNEIDSCTTDASGTATLLLVSGEYTVEISHLSAFFSIQESTVTLTAENNSYEAIFEESSEMQMLYIYVLYDDGSVAETSKVQVYTINVSSMSDASLLAVNTLGFAATFINNEDTYLIALDTDGNFALSKYSKNGPTELNMILQKGVKAGESEENALPITVLLDLPFNDDAFLTSTTRTFTAGEYLYLRVLNAADKTVSINGNLFTLEYNGVEIAPDDNGVISLWFDDIIYGEDAIIKITAKEDATEDLKLKEPSVIVVSSNASENLTQAIEFFGAGHTKYLSFVNMEGTDLNITIESEGVDITVDYIEGTRVEKGHSVTIKIIGNGYGNATITITAEEVIDDSNEA